MRDITDSDTGRGGRGARLLVVAAAVVVLAGTVLAVRPYAPRALPHPRPTPPAIPHSLGLLGASFHGPVDWLLTGDGVAGGRLWTTSDGGRSWATGFNVPSTTRVVGLQLGADGSGYLATVGFAPVYDVSGYWITPDYGHTFEQHPFPNPTGFVSLGLSTPGDGSSHALFTDKLYPPTGLVYERQPDPAGSWKLVGKIDPGYLANPTPLLGSNTAFAFLDARVGLIATQTTGGLGVYRSVDGGASWALRVLGRPANGEQLAPGAISIERVQGQVYLVAAYPNGTAPPASYLFTSDDRGASWSPALELPTDDGNETPAFVTEDVWWVPFGKAVLLTTDHGGTWSRNGLDLPGSTVVNAVYANDDQRAWAFGGALPGPPQFLYRTVDGGKTWKVVKPPG